MSAVQTEPEVTCPRTTADIPDIDDDALLECLLQADQDQNPQPETGSNPPLLLQYD